MLPSFTRYLIKESMVPPSIALVTGGRSGIGKAIASKIATFPFIDNVLIVSRSVKPEELADEPKFVAVAADITTPEGRSKVVEVVEKFTGATSSSSSTTTTATEKSRKQLRFLVHSAGTIDPIKSIRDVTPEDLQYAMKVNLEGPFFLSTALYDYMVPPGKDNDGDYSTNAAAAVAGRILHVSSGAAHGAPPVGWSVYSITKAAFFQSCKVLDRELSNINKNSMSVRVRSFKPGVVDTSMQGVIRNADSMIMPTVGNFHKMKDNAVAAGYSSSGGGGRSGGDEIDGMQARPPPKGALDSPENVAFFAEWLLIGTTDDEFANPDDPDEYDIRDSSLFSKWIPEVNLPN
jgi:NAD(P)-dependent dehydrogenase (short-subunit alcohol dehydrogenase family)